ncbi:hypothetical protein J6590_061181 [Homalodisca vitripennis]|nr:hypothetical protein J6590_061181 [Homalodisca vitripennis]
MGFHIIYNALYKSHCDCASNKQVWLHCYSDIYGKLTDVIVPYCATLSCTTDSIVGDNTIQRNSHKENSEQAMLNGESLKVSHTGVLLDSDLSFTNHVTCLPARLGRLSKPYRSRSLLPQAAELKRINSLILSVFYYCYPAYGNSIFKDDAERIQKMQNTAFSFVYN